MTLTQCSITANYYAFQQGKVRQVKGYIYIKNKPEEKI